MLAEKSGIKRIVMEQDKFYKKKLLIDLLFLLFFAMTFIKSIYAAPVNTAAGHSLQQHKITVLSEMSQDQGIDRF
jgi:histidinol phosphatase-like enzyme